MDDPSRNPAPPMSADHVHEGTDVAIRPLAIFLMSLVGALFVVAILMGLLFGWFLARTNIQPDTSSAVKAPDEEFTAPALQVSPRQELQAFRTREDRLLGSTQWIDHEQGVVRIPINRAMEIVADEGFPDWPKADVTPSVAESSHTTPPDNADEGAP